MGIRNDPITNADSNRTRANGYFLFVYIDGFLSLQGNPFSKALDA